MNIYDISKRSGVSIATVSRVLNNSTHVSAKTREKVLRVMEECGYVPNAFARGLGLNTMRTVGLLCPDASDPYLARALACLERAFRAQGYNCLLSCTGREHLSRADSLEEMKNRHVDGMVLMGSTFVEDQEKDNDYIRSAAKTMPLVLLNASFACENVYCILCDDQRATCDAARQLLLSGRKRILYLYHSVNYSGRKKLDGYRNAYLSMGMNPDESLIRFFSDEKSDVLQVRDFLQKLERDGLFFDAVLTSEDFLAAGAVKYARASGRRIPEDLSVIGYNNSSLCLCCEPELTSVDNKLQLLCEHCAETLLGVLQGRDMPQKTVFSGELIRRGSAL